nr:ribonuclease H-like domain-containing protein [Tanacetum cinerariifolium]
MLPQAFVTSQDPVWNIDTGASSHLADNTVILTSFSNSSMYPSVFIGNCHSIPFTHIGHSFLHTSSKPLHLNHILVTPYIIKNLISVRQFTRDNDVSVKCDAYGFSIKDYQTRRLLLRCDSTGDLYPVTQQPSSQTLVVLLSFSSTTWHRRLGHQGDDVLCRLESRNLISCRKSKLTTMCHACQLGKHAKLPFYTSESSVDSVFEIIHSDIWTSPIPSESGIKYYAIFLDHFSHFVWVHPLHKKSDLFDNFVAFRAYVNKQFNVDIKALQCDHDGEYDNTRFHDLFRQNGIQFWFSCPRTSQQNGKSERMLRTINNLIRTLLFQAHIPSSYWVEALNMDAHLLNILPFTAINNKIPFTKLYNQTTYEHLRVFECLCYPHVDVLHKLEPRSTPCIFLGYHVNHRGYQCLDLASNKIIILRHVRFDEDVFPSHVHALRDHNWKEAMLDEHNVLITNGTYKARLVANGRSQQQGIDCDETFSLVVKPATIRTVLSLAVSRDWPIHQLDVKNAFLNGHLSETVYMHQPPGFVDSNKPNYVYHLQRSLYGLKQPSRAWFQRFASYATRRIIASLHNEFAMKDLGSLNYFLGISAKRSASGLFLSQSKFAEEILERAHMQNYNPCRTPVDTESKLGSDGDPVCLYIHDPRDPHFTALKRILCYVRGTLDYDMHLHVSSTTQLSAYTDVDWAGYLVTRRSTSECCVFRRDNHLSWSAKRQVTLSCSSAEAEYRGVANRTKHIEIDIHFVRDFVASGQVRVLHDPSRFQYADIFTKGLPTTLFIEFRSSLNVRRSLAHTEGN